MNKKYIIIGIALSLLLHGIFLSFRGTESMKQDKLAKAQINKNTEPKITAVLPQQVKKDEERKIEVAKLNEETPKTAKVEKPVNLPTPPLKELFKPPTLENVVTNQKQGDVLVSEKKEISDYVPELKIDISDVKTVCEAANYFGMRLVAIDNNNNILSEIRVNSPAQVVPFKGSLLDYSNRVRLLPDNYFGEIIASFLREKGAKLYVLIPVAVDLTFSNLQKEAAKREGHVFSQVRATVGRFIKGNDGKYNLLITEVISK